MTITIPVCFVEFDDDKVVVEMENGLFLHVHHETDVSKEPVFDVHGNAEYKNQARTLVGQVFVEIYDGEFIRIDDRLNKVFKDDLRIQIEKEAERIAKEMEAA